MSVHSIAITPLGSVADLNNLHVAGNWLLRSFSAANISRSAESDHRSRGTVARGPTASYSLAKYGKATTIYGQDGFYVVTDLTANPKICTNWP